MPNINLMGFRGFTEKVPVVIFEEEEEEDSDCDFLESELEIEEPPAKVKKVFDLDTRLLP